MATKKPKATKRVGKVNNKPAKPVLGKPKLKKASDWANPRRVSRLSLSPRKGK